MKPIEIIVLTTLYYMQLDPGIRHTTAAKDALHALKEANMIKGGDIETTGEFDCTDLGRAHVKQIRNLKLPLQKLVFIDSHGDPI